MNTIMAESDEWRRTVPDGAVLLYEGRAYTITAAGDLISTEASFQIDEWTRVEGTAAMPWTGTGGLCGIVRQVLADFDFKTRTLRANARDSRPLKD